MESEPSSAGRTAGAHKKWLGATAGSHYSGTRWKSQRSALRDPMLVERIFDHYGVRPALRPILDAPCGTGRLRGVLERRGMRWVGADVSSSMLLEARGTEQGVTRDSCLVRSLVDKLPFRDDAFNVVVCCRLLHHLHDPQEIEAVVGELTRVSYRMVIASFWDSASLHAWRRRVGLRRSEGPDGRRAVSKRILRKIFDAAGAEVVGYHHSFRFVSQQAFVVALKRAPVDARARNLTSLRSRLLDIDLEGVPVRLAKLELSTPHGVMLVVGERESELRAAAELVQAEPLTRTGAIVPFLTGRAYFKRDLLRGKTRWRYGLRSIFGRPVPRLCEHANLVWLRQRLFQTPRPIAAGCLRVHGLPRVQFLLTEEVEDARTLEEFLRDTAEKKDRYAALSSLEDGTAYRTRAERVAVLDEIAREVARMHSLRFLHHDLYPRNVLVGGRGLVSRVFFLDAWAGGPAPNLRGPAYDLACFLLRANETLAPEERERFLERYVAERMVQERPVDHAELDAAIRRERLRLIRRLARRPHELRGLRLPTLDG